MIDLEFGKRFSDIVEKSGITNAKLTELAQISKNNIGNYKNGQIPNATTLYKLSQILGISMEYLLAGKESTDLTPEEQELINCYRAANDQGKRTLLTLAQLQKQEPTSSTSQIG